MTHHRVSVVTLLGTIGWFVASVAAGQSKPIEPDLAALADGRRLQLFNRSVSALREGARKGVRLNEHAGEGVAYVPDVDFAGGTIEFDVRGRDVKRLSERGHGLVGLWVGNNSSGDFANLKIVPQ